MDYKRFTCKECGMVINKSATYQGTMDCPGKHGQMISKEWKETFFYGALIAFFIILFFVSVWFGKTFLLGD
ncbi:MAG: hypothetical protein WAT71_07700 [Ignavibacteria bacterium]